jgi:hypothetical protein
MTYTYSTILKFRRKLEDFIKVPMTDIMGENCMVYQAFLEDKNKKTVPTIVKERNIYCVLSFFDIKNEKLLSNKQSCLNLDSRVL